ncbi:hypothetical protein ACIGG9_11655 [Pseudonocardia alni]|uniref:hypothetical protein n=1 Tax=Pseudonocardia alni TaxID=33907 RepID=UPI0033F333CA
MSIYQNGQPRLVVTSDPQDRPGNPMLEQASANLAADGAARALKAAGVEVPERVRDGYLAFEVVKVVPVAPEPPSLFADSKTVDQYHADYRGFLVRRDAHDARVAGGRQELKRLVAETTNDVLASIRDRFEAATGKFVEAHRGLQGVGSLEDAATDPTGDGVRLWHQRGVATKELNSLTGAVNGWMKANRHGQSLTTMQLVALVAIPGFGCRDLYARIREDKSPHARWAALVDAGWSVELAPSVAVFRERCDLIDDRMEDPIADDPSIRTEVLTPAKGTAKRVKR